MKVVIFPNRHLFAVCLLLFFSFSAFGQRANYKKCKVDDSHIKSAKYYVGGADRVQETLGVRISVKESNVNETDLSLVAKRLKATYCNEDELVVLIFVDKVPARRFDTTFKSSIDALRGEYVLSKSKGEEYISFVKIPDYFNNANKRIRIDLNNKTR